ncbi:MAG TPA: SPOR domain-containing protein [Candidatus Binataceae bacterium]|nr:SPOR domain-containing protein [Candidatus Binataceae bacterium]
MRFEIRAGGALLFLVGLAVLSGTVFALGLIGGYEMARQNQSDSSQFAVNYPLPSPAAAMASPAALIAPPPAKPAAPIVRANAPVAAPPTHRVRAVSVARAATQPPPEEDEEPGEASVPPGPNPDEQAPPEVEHETAAIPPSRRYESSSTGEATVPPARVASAERQTSHRHPYNIQIDAVMDSAGAQQMADRLRRLGYTPAIIQTNVAGQTWYRIKVGPYSTQEEAQAAQDRLRSQYNATYAGH